MDGWMDGCCVLLSFTATIKWIHVQDYITCSITSMAIDL